MYLSKLEIIGFKSFAQKVNLAFDSGISAIVGPNGCGKTNIVDAIRWVLGEQRYSALRSEKMEDVIFNGTKNRKPLGMAEASLVIENNKGILPSEYSQVTIGRRVYRSGESEYLLNKVPCRLKDILDLFMDTGMGADAYSVIELKMIETILSDKTDERRRLFEEAAGVTKYKHRRKAAYRKLEAVQADLVRVNDIVAEVQKAVNSLERQARKAEQYNEVKQRLRTLEIDLMEREYAQLVGRVQPLEEKLGTIASDKERIDVDLSQEESRLEELRISMSDVERRLAEAQRDASVQTEKITRVEQKNLVAAERAKALQNNIARYEKEKEELAAEKARLEERVATLEQEIATIQSALEESRHLLEEKKGELEECTGKLEAKKEQLSQLNDRTIELVHAIAEKQTELDKLKGRAENLSGRSARAADENESYESELIRLAEEIEQHSTEDKKLRRSSAEAEMKSYEAEQRKKELHEQVEALQQQDMNLLNEIKQRRGRIDFLKGLIESREGLSESIRYLASTGRWSRPSNHLTVADAVRAEPQYMAAIEAALGDYANLVIVDSAESAEQAIALLKEEEKGKATFICRDRLPRVHSRYSPVKEEGVHGWASELASYDESNASLMGLLFDKVLIVENADAARRVAAQYSGVRCVTLEGEFTTGAGITRGGSKRLEEGGILGRQSQIEQLEREVAELTGKHAMIKEEHAAVVVAHDAINLKSFTENVKAIEKEMSGIEVRMAQLEFERKRANDIIARNTEEIAALKDEAAELYRRIEDETPGLEQLREEKSVIERNVGLAVQERDALESVFDERSAAVNELEIRLVQLKGSLQNAENELQRSRETIANIIATLEKRSADIAVAQEEIVLANASMQENETALAGLMDEFSFLESRKATVEKENLHVREEMHRIQLKIRDERKTHDDAMKAVHELELKLADLKAKIEHLKEKAFTEFEMQLEVKTYPEDEFVDFAALRDDIQAARDKIKSLGNINFAAFEEFSEEKQRFEFLTTQRNDLIEAEKTLLATIEEINTTAQQKFLETFEKIRLNFIETFKSLFDPGDECDLKLEEDVDPLEAGIDIIAKPRGKRPTSIHLLSGGEKTLTATALLFAIYLVKPSPFCILDEVDAPLDDANVDRFTRILRKFSDNTQFIVVTHNKRTMESANALYGVTMEEEGVSKLVTVRFNQGSQVQSAAVVSG